MNTLTFETHPAIEEDRHNHEFPPRCCRTCHVRFQRETSPQLPPVTNQFYYCGVCDSIWGMTRRVPGWWSQQWSISRLQATVDALRFAFVVSSFFGVLATAISFVTIKGWTDNVGLTLGFIAAVLIAWAVAIGFVDRVIQYLSLAAADLWSIMWPSPTRERSAS